MSLSEHAIHRYEHAAADNHGYRSSGLHVEPSADDREVSWDVT